MPKFVFFVVFFLTIFFNTNVFATTSRIYDFNSSSDLINYFNPNDDTMGSISDYGGINFSKSIDSSTGYENIWTTKKGFITSGTGDVFSISGYYYNQDLFGYGSFGFSNSDINYPDYSERATPPLSIGFVFHGGGGYLVNNGVYTEILWPPDLDDNSWYKFSFTIENLGGNHFLLIATVYKADELGNTLSRKSYEFLEVENTELGSAAKLYAYFGNSISRFSYIDNIKLELTGAIFEEDGKPEVTTTTANNINGSSGEAGGEVINEAGSSVSARGVCYSTSPNPTISGICTSDGAGVGIYNSNLSNLTSGTKYYYRSYATNGNGTSYGIEKNLNTAGLSTQNSKVVFKKDNKCRDSKPPKTNWIKAATSVKNGQQGITLTWSQQGSNKISIYIDNGTKKFPFVISKTKNDGQEFLPNVSALQKIKILPYNGCRTGDYSKSVSVN